MIVTLWNYTEYSGWHFYIGGVLSAIFHGKLNECSVISLNVIKVANSNVNTFWYSFCSSRAVWPTSAPLFLITASWGRSSLDRWVTEAQRSDMTVQCLLLIRDGTGTLTLNSVLFPLPSTKHNMELFTFHGVYILLVKGNSEYWKIDDRFTWSSQPKYSVHTSLQKSDSCRYSWSTNKRCGYLLDQRLILSMVTSVCCLKLFEYLNV